MRSLVALAVLEAVVIAVLAALLLLQSPDQGPVVPPLASPGPEVSATPEVVTARPLERASGPVEAAAPGPVERAEVGAGSHADVGSVLFGRVLARDGGDVTGAVISARPAGGRTRVTAHQRDARGYALPGLEPGAWELRCRAEGYQDRVIEVELDGRGPRRLDIVLAGAHVLKVAAVADDGRPLAEVLSEHGLRVTELVALATVDEPPAAFPMTTLRTVHRLGVGKWRRGGPELPERYLGELELAAPPPVWVSVAHRHLVVARELVPPGTDEVELVVPVAGLEATFGGARLQVVASETGAPLPDVTVSFSDRQSSGPRRRPDADGVVAFDRLPAGILELTIRGKGREAYHRFVRIHGGRELDLGMVAVDPQGTFSGSVAGPDGAPAAGATLQWFRLDRTDPDLPLDNGFAARADSEGRFEIRGVGRGRYLIEASLRDVGVGSVVVDSSRRQVEGVRIELADSRVEIVNEVPSTEVYLLVLRASEGHRVFARHVRPGPDFWISVPPGRYTAEIRTDSGMARTAPLVVGAGGGNRITVP